MTGLKHHASLAATVLLMAACAAPTPGPTQPDPQPTATAQPEPTPGPTPTAQPSVEPSPSPAPSVSPSAPLSFEGKVERLAGNGKQGNYASGSGKATDVPLGHLSGLVPDQSGLIFFIEGNQARIGRLSLPFITPGQATGAKDDTYRIIGSLMTEQGLRNPQGLVAYQGGLLVADSYAHRILKVSQSGEVTTFAGTGQPEFAGDGGDRLQAAFSGPLGLAVDQADNVYVADSNNQVIRRIDAQGRVTTIAGVPRRQAEIGENHDGKPALGSPLSAPQRLAVTSDGVIYVLGNQNQIHRIAKDGKLYLAVGNGGVGYDDKEVKDARKTSLGRPQSIVVGPDDLLYIADTENERIRRLNPDGSLVVVAGNGRKDNAGEYGLTAMETPVGRVTTLAFDAEGNLHYFDARNYRLKVIKLRAGN